MATTTTVIVMTEGTGMVLDADTVVIIMIGIITNTKNITIRNTTTIDITIATVIVMGIMIAAAIMIDTVIVAMVMTNIVIVVITIGIAIADIMHIVTATMIEAMIHIGGVIETVVEMEIVETDVEIVTEDVASTHSSFSNFLVT